MSTSQIMKKYMFLSVEYYLYNQGTYWQINTMTIIYTFPVSIGLFSWNQCKDRLPFGRFVVKWMNEISTLFTFSFLPKIWMLCWVCKGNDANLSKIELYCYFWPTLQMLLAVNVKVCCIKAMSENMKIANVSNRNMKMYQTASFSAANSDIVFLLQP